MGRSMLLWYDFEGDVMEIIFDERLHLNENKAAYSLQMGFVLYINDKLLAFLGFSFILCREVTTGKIKCVKKFMIGAVTRFI